MTLPTTNLSFSALQNEFGGSNPISMSEYYRDNSSYSSLSNYVSADIGDVGFGLIPTSSDFSFGTFRRAGSYVIDSPSANIDLRSWAVSKGWDGVSFIQISIKYKVPIWGLGASSPAIIINGSWPGGLKLVNRGTIMGSGGDGGDGIYGGGGGGNGGNAIEISLNANIGGAGLEIYNGGWICGGGGGGGSGAYVYQGTRVGYAAMGGGGGAGGGNGGPSRIYGGEYGTNAYYGTGTTSVYGGYGGNYLVPLGSGSYGGTGGGGGGGIYNGSGGTFNIFGGGGGGFWNFWNFNGSTPVGGSGGGASNYAVGRTANWSGDGGSGGDTGGNAYTTIGGGGGGGLGAAGGSGGWGGGGGTGGKAISLNGKSITFNQGGSYGYGTYGAIS